MDETVEQLLQEARDESEHFTPERVPNGVLRRKLDRYYRRLYFNSQKINATLFYAEEEVVFPLNPFADGYQDFPEYITILGGDVHFDGTEDPSQLNFVPYERRYDPNMNWPAYFVDRTLYFCRPESAWNPVTKAVVTYVPEPEPLTQMSDSPDLPQGARPVLVNYLARFMAKRIDEVSGKMSVFKEDYKTAKADWYEEIGQAEARAETTTWGEDW